MFVSLPLAQGGIPFALLAQRNQQVLSQETVEHLYKGAAEFLVLLWNEADAGRIPHGAWLRTGNLEDPKLTLA